MRAPVRSLALAMLWAGAVYAAAATPAAPASAAEPGAQPAAQAGGPTGGSQLERYLTGLRTLSASFTQTVTDARGKPVSTGSGMLLLERPGRFRWSYVPRSQRALPPGERGQLLVADGRNLWFYDRELEQVTVKPLASALTATPVMLLTGTAAQLHAGFILTSSAPHDGLQWVDVKPRQAGADFSRAQVGFRDGQLARMIVQEQQGQTVQLDFSHSRRNVPIAPAQLRFTPPAGADVIGTALPP